MFVKNINIFELFHFMHEFNCTVKIVVREVAVGEIKNFTAWGSCCWGKLVTGEVSIGKISGWGSSDCVNCFGEVALGK